MAETMRSRRSLGIGQAHGNHRSLLAVTICGTAVCIMLSALTSQSWNFVTRDAWQVASAFCGPIALIGISPGGQASAQQSRYTSKVKVRSLGPLEEEEITTLDQPLDELALDARELLITDANVFFVGPDIENYMETVRDVTKLLNYTFIPFDFSGVQEATSMVDSLEKAYAVPPLLSALRWPWTVMRQGLVIWLDPDGYKHLDVFERDRIRKLKFPKKKAAFGPDKPMALLDGSDEPLGDPIDMWMEADVHVDIRKAAAEDIPISKMILASLIDTILENPPKWRGWFKQAKMKGTIPNDHETPFQVRRSFHSHGVSPRLNRLLSA